MSNQYTNFLGFYTLYNAITCVERTIQDEHHNAFGKT